MTASFLVFAFAFTTQSFNLPSGLLSALCYVESADQVNAVHKDDGGGDSLGVCQIKETTAKIMGFKGAKRDLMNPVTNIYWAGKYLAKQLIRYNGNYFRAISAYNSGTYRRNRLGRVSNQPYVNKVLKAWGQRK